MRFNGKKLCALSAATVAVGALGMLPGTAGAAFDSNHDQNCEGSSFVDSITGRGASLQRAAHLNGWGAAIGPTTATASQIRNVGFGYAANTFLSPGGCRWFALAADSGTESVLYDPVGSGNGRAALGATTVADRRHTDTAGRAITPVNFGGTEEAPTTTELTNAFNGSASGSFDDNTRLHTIPVAATAVAVNVRVPNGCGVNADPADRRIGRSTLELAFRGDTSADTWGEVLPSVTGTGTVGSSNGVACRSIRFNRVVRLDSSGTTFSFKRYLTDINGSNPPNWAGLANNAWPAGGRAPVTGVTTGVESQLTALDGQTEFGGLGYGDLAASRGHGYGWFESGDDDFWLYVENSDSPSSDIGPAVDDAQSGFTAGAACGAVSYTDARTGRLPATTLDSWFEVDGVPTSADYPICALTYVMAWDDAADVNRGINRSDANFTGPLSQSQTRSTKDYINYLLNGGQTALAGLDYARLSTAVRTIAQEAVDNDTTSEIGWNK